MTMARKLGVTSNAHEKEFERADAFLVYRNFLWFLGVWPLENQNYFQTFRYAIAAMVQASFMLHTVAEMYMNTGGILAMVDVCLFFASAFLALIKHTYLHIHQEKIAENLRFYLKDWDEIKQEDYIDIMKSHHKIYRYQFIIYNSVGYFGTGMFLIRTILINLAAKQHLEPDSELEYKFVCQISYLPNKFLSDYYVIILAIQYIQCMYCCTSGACIDCFFFGLVFHLCAQLEILKNKWQNLGIWEIVVENVVSRKHRRIELVELVKRHRDLVQLGENVEESFNNTLLAQLITSVMLICMSGCSILVAMMNDDYVTMLVSTNCISFMITESFIYGYASDYLVSQSGNIHQAVYDCAWYELDNRSRKDVAFIMMRAQQPLGITAGKFFNVTRNTIVQLLKTTASYISVLRLTLESSNREQR